MSAEIEAMCIEATYRAVTPMFCGGADPRQAELRLSSFKGVLRYWWRALAWADHKGDLEKIHERENELFGSAAGGQSLLTMRLGTVAPDLDKIRMKKGEPLTVSGKARHGGAHATGAGRGGYRSAEVGFGAQYLGYGVIDKGKLSRGCLSAPFEFQVRIRVRNPTRNANQFRRFDLNLLQNALIALGVFGGMGAKSRKGYGSLVLRSLTVNDGEHWNVPRSASDLESRIKQLHWDGRNAARLKHDGNAALPKYTAFSAGTRHLLVSGNSNRPLGLLDLLGLELVGYRRELVGYRSRGKQPDKRLHLVAFGLPRNYGKNPTKQIKPAAQDLDRRASPLFIHIHECGTKPVAVLSFIPARFLPEGKSDISVGEREESQKLERDPYQPICDFFSRLLDPGKRKEKDIESVIEVKP